MIQTDGAEAADGESTATAEPVEFEAVIFDLDGTLADTLDDIADAMNRVLRRARVPPTARPPTSS